MKTIGHRIHELIHYYRLNKNSFSIKIGLTNNTVIGRLVNDPFNRTPSFDVLLMIIKAFPEVSTDWLVTGEGKMLKGENSEKEIYDLHARSIPYYPKPIRFASDTENGVITVEASERIVVPGSEKGDIAMGIYASNMMTVFKSGDIVVCRRVKPDGLIITNEVYLFANSQNQFIKRVVAADGQTIAISDDVNPNNSQKITRDDFPHVWQILFVVSRISM